MTIASEPSVNDRIVELLSIRARLGHSTSSSAVNIMSNCVKRSLTSVIHDSNQQTVGYVAWADINKESFRKLLNSGKAPRYPYEWNEGKFLLILDVVARKNGMPTMRTILRQKFPNRRVIAYVRNNVLSVYVRTPKGLRLALRNIFVRK